MQKYRSLLRSFSFECFVFILFLSLFFNTSALCQGVIVHNDVSYSEDGDPIKDADGIKNGQVVWKAGPVHIINRSYVVMPDNSQSSSILITEPGAIIKVAGEFIVDQNGKLVSWQSPWYEAKLSAGLSGYIKLIGATITCIEDDTEGGDTNEDGSASTPRPWGVISMSGGAEEIIQDNTIKYCVTIGGIGSIQISGNHFLESGGIGEHDSQPYTRDVVFNAVPVITKNVFDGAVLDLTGMSPIVENNTFHGPISFDRTAITVGPRFLSGNYPDEPAGPISGTTIISGNTFENCAYGIQVYSSSNFPEELAAKTPPFKITIRDNRLKGTGIGCGISVGFSNKAEILYNEIDNFGKPFVIQHDTRYNKFSGEALNGLIINHNKMTRFNKYEVLDSISYKYWSKGIFVDAKFNDWGDPTGPEDKSQKDDLYNPFGKGLTVGNGINYRNFIGAAAEVIVDAILISATSNPPAPFKPKTEVTFQVNVDEYKLKSSQTGKISIMIRDDTDMLLNGLGTILDVVSGNNSAVIPPIQITVPEFASQIKVEASLAPDGNDAFTVFSNSILFFIEQPKSTFQLTSIKDIVTGKFPKLAIGTNAALRFDLTYLLAGTGNGRFDIQLKERVAGSGKLLHQYELSALEIKPGSNLKASMDLQVAIGDYSNIMKEGEQSELYYLITMKDNQGKVSGNVSGTLAIKKNQNYAHIYLAIPFEQRGDQTVLVSRSYYPTGIIPVLAVQVSYQIETPDVSNWQIQVGPLDVLDNNGNLLHSYLPTTVHWKNLATTGNQSEMLPGTRFMMPPGSPEIPEAAAKVRVHISLIDPNKGAVVYNEHWYEIPVRSIYQTVEKDITQGPSQVSFDPIPITLKFTSNNESGKVSVNEFYKSNNGFPLAKRLNGGQVEGFIYLNRYWSVYDSLKEGSYTSQISITYDPAKDFPAEDFSEDSLVITPINPNNGRPEALPSILDRSSHTITADYSRFYELYLISAKTISPTTVSRSTAVPEKFMLAQNYPNPFNPSTIINYTVPKFSFVTIKVYNNLGKEIATLVNESKIMGNYEIKFDVSNISSGVYFYRMISGSYAETKKMLLLK